MEHSKLLRRIITLSIMAVVLFIAIYFVYADIRHKNKKVSVLDNDLSFKNNQYDYLVSMQKAVENLAPDILKIDNSIIPASGDVDFIESIESIARSYNLAIEIESLTLVNDPKMASSTVSTLKIKAKVDGSWAGTYTFLSELESLPFKIRINRFSLISNEGLVPVLDSQLDQNKKWQTSFEISVLKYK